MALIRPYSIFSARIGIERYQELSAEKGGMFFDVNSTYSFTDFTGSHLAANFGGRNDRGARSADGGGNGD